VCFKVGSWATEAQRFLSSAYLEPVCKDRLPIIFKGLLQLLVGIKNLKVYLKNQVTRDTFLTKQSMIMKKAITITLMTLLIYHFSYGQLTLGSQSDQSITINQNITFTQPGDTLKLNNFSIKTSMPITFTNRVIIFNNVSIKSDSTILFSNSSTVFGIKNSVDLSCSMMSFPGTLLTLAGMADSTGNSKDDKISPALAVRFKSLSPANYHIAADASVSFSITNKSTDK
jgi:hypothetical protein